MKKINALMIGIFLVTLSGFSPGCVTDMASLEIEKSLPQNKLAYYNDSFDKLRIDLWEKAGYIPNEDQKANFNLAKMRVEDGRLWVQTETGCFSAGGLGSKYTIRGDFDIQVGCHIDFLEGVYDMDQLLVFAAIGKGKELGKDDTVFLSLLKKGGRDFSTIFSAVRKNGKFQRGEWRKIKNFDGNLRIVRIGDEISTLFKKKTGPEWMKMDTFRSTPNDMMVGFKLQNFTSIRVSITARSHITATFDNFRINAAQEIIEEEI